MASSLPTGAHSSSTFLWHLSFLKCIEIRCSLGFNRKYYRVCVLCLVAAGLMSSSDSDESTSSNGSSAHLGSAITLVTHSNPDAPIWTQSAKNAGPRRLLRRWTSAEESSSQLKDINIYKAVSHQFPGGNQDRKHCHQQNHVSAGWD